MALLARLDQWARLEKMADPDLLEPQARRALPDSLEQQANLACLGLLVRRARWARMVPTVCRVPREPWGPMVFRVSRVLRVSWAHRGSQASQARPASTACPVLRGRPVSEELQEPTGLAECQEPTVHRELPARVALLVRRVPPARPESLAPPAHMARGMVTITVAECFDRMGLSPLSSWTCMGIFRSKSMRTGLTARGIGEIRVVLMSDAEYKSHLISFMFFRSVQCAFATCVPFSGN